ncbi:hypothetical protein GQ457_09G005040 [Hibiscus cannabinus]
MERAEGSTHTRDLAAREEVLVKKTDAAGGGADGGPGGGGELTVVTGPKLKKRERFSCDTEGQSSLFICLGGEGRHAQNSSLSKIEHCSLVLFLFHFIKIPKVSGVCAD